MNVTQVVLEELGTAVCKHVIMGFRWTDYHSYSSLLEDHPGRPAYKGEPRYSCT
ncbi:hypothetical protein HispidOSU_026804, partial [Sigmodon hispidus]